MTPPPLKKMLLLQIWSWNLSVKDHKELRSIVEEGKGKLQWERSVLCIVIVFGCIVILWFCFVLSWFWFFITCIVIDIIFIVIFCIVIVILSVVSHALSLKSYAFSSNASHSHLLYCHRIDDDHHHRQNHHHWHWPISRDIPAAALANLESLASNDFKANLGRIIHDIYQVILIIITIITFIIIIITKSIINMSKINSDGAHNVRRHAAGRSQEARQVQVNFLASTCHHIIAVIIII